MNEVVEKSEIKEFFMNLDWESLLFDSMQINDSYYRLKMLHELGLIDGILTHCSNKMEAYNKMNHFQKVLPQIEVICLKKDFEKCDYVDPVGKILVDDYIRNLVLWENAGGIGIKFSDKIKNKEKYTIYEENGKVYKFRRITDLIELVNISLELEQKEKNLKRTLRR